jgi:hypothetical protein
MQCIVQAVSTYIWEKREYPSKEGHVFMLSLGFSLNPAHALPASKCGKDSTERRKDTREEKEVSVE